MSLFVPRIVSCLALVLALTARPASGQTLSIGGVARDASGGVVADASITAVVGGRPFNTAVTAADGTYRLEVPARRPVRLEVQREGFAAAVVFVQVADSPVTQDVVLQVGGVSDTLVVTASRSPESRASVTESVTSFTRTELDAIGGASLADVMRFVPGVSMANAGREGALTSMFSRGGESDYNLVLIDGVRVNASGGTFDFSRISAREIDRVEVVRGAQSSLWGSDAMGAVVQIFTRGADADALRLSETLEGGSFGTVRNDTRVSGGGRAADFQLGVSHRRTNGAFETLLPERDAFDQTSVDGVAGGRLGSRASVRGGFRYSDAAGRNVGPIDFGSRDTGGVYDTTDLSAHVTTTHVVGSRLTGTATFNYYRNRGRSSDTVGDAPFGTYAVLSGTPNALFPNGTRLVRFIGRQEFDTLVAAGAHPGAGEFLASRQSSDFPFESLTQFRRPAFRYQGDATWGSQRLSVGYEWERETNPLTPDFELVNHAVFVQQQFSTGTRWFATVGARVDARDSYDTFATPRMSVGGFLLPSRRGAVSSLKVTGNLGKGIKSPTFSERFGGSFADPSPDLKVERARTADIGAELMFADQRFRALVTYFTNDYVDQIAFRSGAVGDGLPEFINIDGSRADGWELEWAILRPLGGFTATATYAVVDSRVVTNLSTNQQFQTGQPLLRRPKHSGTIRAAYAAGPGSVFVDVRIVGDRHDNSFLSLRTVPGAAMPSALTTDITVNPGYAVAGLGAEWRLRRATLFLRSDNVGDTRYADVLGYPGLPRSFTVGARVNVSLLK